MTKKTNSSIKVDTLTHDEATRKNIPTVELQSLLDETVSAPVKVRYPRNTDLDPQLVWRGKDEQDWSDLVVNAPPLYIQEKIHPKAIIDDLIRRKKTADDETEAGETIDLFADFNGTPDESVKYDFYAHDQHWTNRMILGDSLQVMASLAEREGLRGKVQCIYIDPPYGIKFNSNWQVSTRSRDVKDGKQDHISREPEQVKAFRDTWSDGIHSYLTYLRDRLTVARDLLTDSGSVFVQIGDENVHRIRCLMDEIFGDDNFVSQISYTTTGGLASGTLSRAGDYILWYAKSLENLKYRDLLQEKKQPDDDAKSKYDQFETSIGIRTTLSEAKQLLSEAKFENGAIFRIDNIVSQGSSENTVSKFKYFGHVFDCGANNHWKTNPTFGMPRLAKSNRIVVSQKGKLGYVRYFNDFPIKRYSNLWIDIGGSVQSRSDPKVYVVQTGTALAQRCILMVTDPGDLILDPTCGSGTTAYVAEQWGRRWITIDTSRVALALARARIMGARYPWYLLTDSPEGKQKEGDLTGKPPADTSARNDIRQGFVYERVPHITLKSIANNAEIDVIWEQWQETLEPVRAELNTALDKDWEEWQIPRDAGDRWVESVCKDFDKLQKLLGDAKKQKQVDKLLLQINTALGRKYTLDDLPEKPLDPWPEHIAEIHQRWWEARISRQQEIDDAIGRNADTEYLYDKPYEDKRRARVSGPFTVESLSPHRVQVMQDDDDDKENIPKDWAAEAPANFATSTIHSTTAKYTSDSADFAQVVLDHLRTAGVQQAHKEDRIEFTSLTPWPGRYIAAEGRYLEAEHLNERRAAIFIGPEFGTVSRPDLVAAAREAIEAGFSIVVACAFNYDAPSAEFNRIGAVPILKARMNPDLHMADDLKNTGQGNLFVVFGEPDIEIEDADDNQIRVRILGVDVFDPQKGEVRSSDTDDIAAWFIDTDYNEESFFVRQAYFLGANDPYKSLKTTLKAEIDEDAWASLYRDVSRAFPRPATGRIAVKVINHFGDEVMKVFSV